MVLRVLVLSAAVAALTAPAGRAADPVKIDARTEKAVDKALDWLQSKQDKDGCWGRSNQTAITAFVLLAFMSDGHLPNQGKYGPEVAKGARFLLAASRDSGYLSHPKGGGNMYAHGMATLALTQLWGMTGDEEVKKVLAKAVALIVKTQNHEGGWRYEPAPTGADISVTIMMVMALRGAKDSGLHVPDKTMAKARAYIDSCYHAKSGGYTYQARSGSPGYARTAAGVCVLQLGGEYDADEIAKAVQYLEAEKDDNQHYWYGHYYAAHAMHQVGGKKWEDYYDRLKSKLLATQKSSGEWHERMEANVGSEYQTAIGVLILCVPSHYLPIYQR